MAGSPEPHVRAFPDSRLHLDQISRLFGESDDGPVTSLVISALEGALFSAYVVVSMTPGAASFAGLNVDRCADDDTKGC